MSQLIGAARPTNTVRANDDSLRDGMYVRPYTRRTYQVKTRILSPRSFATPWWPGNGGLTGDQGVDISLSHDAIRYMGPRLTKGVNSRFGYQGVTRDVNNSILGGCTVKVFRTSTDEMQLPNVTSDPTTGEFVVSTAYYEPHYIYTRKTGSPDVGGVSASTIYPNT